MSPSRFSFHKKLFGLFLMILFVLFVFTRCEQSEEAVPVADTAELEQALNSFDEEYEYEEEFVDENGRYFGKCRRRSTLFTATAALIYTGLLPVINTQVTLFLPDDIAFAKAGLYPWNICRVPKDVLTNILLYHAAEGRIFAAHLPACSFQMINESTIGFEFKSKKVLIKDASEKRARILLTDKRVCKSVFHVIDKVLEPPSLSLVDIASDDNFSILVELLDATGLLDVVADPEANITVFAPTNSAFEALEEDNPGILEYLSDNPDLLTQVLLHHVVNPDVGIVFSFCLSDGFDIPTANGDFIEVVNLKKGILRSSGGVEVGLVPSGLDLLATNGVIHVINYVLVPSFDMDV
jgi:uncharacterized surface protein with fasciclin (FAS1) repeats